eukprot:m.343040 g.343040  ORF g.343040 m.343040 type:complete len:884 (-) comp22244_c0_seq1:144-2795(-)
MINARFVCVVYLFFIVSAHALQAKDDDNLYVGNWKGPITGLPNGKIAAVPLLGNGYMGVAVGTGAAANNSLDFWTNTNAMWFCSPNSKPYPDAVCAMKAFAGVSVTPQLSIFSLDNFTTQQRIKSAQITSQYYTQSGGTLAIVLYMHPSQNVIVTNITWSRGDKDPQTVPIQVTSWTFNASGLYANSSVVNSKMLVSTRRMASNSSTTSSEKFRVMWTSLAVTTRNGFTATSSANVGKNLIAAFGTVPVSSSATTSIIAALADNLLHDNGYIPTNDAVTEATNANEGETAMASAIWWSSYWAKSNISLPSSPALDSYWHGAQYITACMSVTQDVLTANNGLVPPPGLYGPWVTSENPSWHGDYTLDYNQEAQYYGMFSSNHGDNTAPYYAPIEDWMVSANKMAKDKATQDKLNCPPNALHYACHLAPWGYQSQDQSVYMHWNGNFAALLFINNWEYTRNVTWAKTHAYPLLDGLNAFWSCFLKKKTVGKSYIYEDFNILDPDNEHENQRVPNPQIALALIRRSLSAQLDMAKSIGISAPSYVQDILTHLAPYNTGKSMKPPAPSPTLNCSDVGNFNVQQNTRCSNDYHMGSESTVECCRARCESEPECIAFTFCPSKNVSGCPDGPSCWQYNTRSSCGHQGEGFVSGSKTHSPSPSPSPPPSPLRTVWTAFDNATPLQSDAFSLYPLWPSEMIDINASVDTLQIARASIEQYAMKNGLVNGRPVLVFPAAVRAGYNPVTLIASFNNYLSSSQTQSFLPVAPGGGTENTGVAIAINDMLVQAPHSNYIHLFPVWDTNQTASFQNLLCKGGFEVSATWNAEMQTVQQFSVKSLSSQTCSVRNPWSANKVKVSCTSGQSPTITYSNNNLFFSYSAPQNQVCTITTL